MTLIRIKRVYEDPEESDGYRVLVDRLWPLTMISCPMIAPAYRGTDSLQCK